MSVEHYRPSETRRDALPLLDLRDLSTGRIDKMRAKLGANPPAPLDVSDLPDKPLKVYKALIAHQARQAQVEAFMDRYQSGEKPQPPSLRDIEYMQKELGYCMQTMKMGIFQLPRYGVSDAALHRLVLTAVDAQLSFKEAIHRYNNLVRMYTFTNKSS